MRRGRYITRGAHKGAGTSRRRGRYNTCGAHMGLGTTRRRGQALLGVRGGTTLEGATKLNKTGAKSVGGTLEAKHRESGGGEFIVSLWASICGGRSPR